MQVEVRDVVPRRTAVVAAVTTWEEFPSVWRALSEEVWACLRAVEVDRGHRNVMLFLDDRPSVEIGVLLSEPVALSGRVAPSSLPAGRVATAVHRGGYDRLAETHEHVQAWCRRHGERPTRVRWEVYGPHHDDSSRLWTEVSWLLEPLSR